MAISPHEGRAQGEANKLRGIDHAARQKDRSMKLAQLRLLDAAMDRRDRTCTASDMTDDLAGRYRDGGKWVGAAVRSLASLRLITKSGFAVSARPSRHAGDIKMWRVVNDGKANLFRRALRLWLTKNPPPPDEDDGDGALFPNSNDPKKPSPAGATAGLVMKGSNQ